MQILREWAVRGVHWVGLAGAIGFGGAAQAFAHVLTIEPDNEAAIAGMARVYLAGGDAEQARQTIAMAPADSKDPGVVSVRASSTRM